MAISQITSNSIAAGAVSASDLADGSISTAKIADSAVTNAKIDTVAAGKVTGQLADSNMAPGCVIQVLGTLYESTQTTSSGTFAAVSGCSVTITPSSTNSRILIMYTGWGNVPGNGIHGIATIYRNSTNLNGNYGNNFYTSSGGYTEFGIGLSYFDSPATTSAITYQIYIRTDGAGSFVFGGSANRRGSLTVMEIAG